MMSPERTRIRAYYAIRKNGDSGRRHRGRTGVIRNDRTIDEENTGENIAAYRSEVGRNSPAGLAWLRKTQQGQPNHMLMFSCPYSALLAALCAAAFSSGRASTR